METKKMLYIEFIDRNGVTRCAVANGAPIPAGVIAGKGWRVKTTYKLVPMCRCGHPEHVWDESCPYNDHE